MKLIFNITKALPLLVCFVLTLPAMAQAAENPWQKHYAEQQLEADNPTANLPSAGETFSITFQEVQDAIAKELMHQGVADRLRVTIPRRGDSAVMTYREPLTMVIDQLTYDKKQGTWQAVGYFSAGSKNLAPVKLAGRYEEVVELPMLKKRVSNGETIEASNIELQEFGISRLRGEAIYSAQQLVGKTPKHSISALRPIRADEVITPPVVHKGDTVSVAYKTAAMEIKTIGQALENGAEGDTIKIRNQDSHTVIQATVTGKGTAQITTLSNTTAP